ncbi:MAG: hypothetical protein HFF52_09000 [Lawsonibacter sp.]|nr:hypothetical protein [Lawsonibacter sp.]
MIAVFINHKPKVFRELRIIVIHFLYSAFPSTLGNASEQSSGNFHFHLPNQLSQFFLAFSFSSGVDIPGHAFSVDLWGVASLPEIIPQLSDTARPRFAVFALDRLESGATGKLAAAFNL